MIWYGLVSIINIQRERLVDLSTLYGILGITNVDQVGSDRFIAYD